jgi:Fe-S cluster biogenesis protein NfuA
MTDTNTEIQISAEPQTIPTNCLYKVDRMLFPGMHYTEDADFAKEWMPLAAAIMKAVEGVKGVRVGGQEVLVTMATTPTDWRDSAKATGACIREFVAADGVAVKEGAGDHMEGTDLYRHQAQAIIENELNPNLASHGGWVEIQASDGTELYLSMNGGCQGCGSAAMTMRQGVETSIKNAVPEITAVHDATDHAAGTNPYM